jgi:hypothetical protein
MTATEGAGNHCDGTRTAARPQTVNSQLLVSPHDLYLTIGETVGTPEARFPTSGLTGCISVRRSVSKPGPYTYGPASRRFTTVSSWLGGEYVTERDRVLFRKRQAHLVPAVPRAAGENVFKPELVLYFKPSPDAAGADWSTQVLRRSTRGWAFAIKATAYSSRYADSR